MSAGALWIIDPSMETAETQGVEMIARLWGGDTRLFRPALCPGEGPDSGTTGERAGIVLMGSAASPHADHRWLKDLSDFLRPLILGTSPAPLFGICFGHQLMACIAGGEVGYLHVDRRKRLGIEETFHSSESRLVPSGKASVLVSHREIVTRPPADFVTVACRDGVSHDALEHPALPLFSVQYHPEAGGDFAAHAALTEADLAEGVRPHGDALLMAFMRVCRAFPEAR